MIGANRSGNHSLLEVFSLLTASAAGKPWETINGLGGIDSNLTTQRFDEYLFYRPRLRGRVG